MGHGKAAANEPIPPLGQPSHAPRRLVVTTDDSLPDSLDCRRIRCAVRGVVALDMNRLAITSVVVDDADELLCSAECPALTPGDGNDEASRCGAFNEPLAWDYPEAVGYRLERCAPCLSATAQADRLVAVGDAAAQWKRDLDDLRANGGGAIRSWEQRLYLTVAESTRAETERK